MSMNVYADLGFENPEMELAKARIISVLQRFDGRKGDFPMLKPVRSWVSLPPKWITFLTATGMITPWTV